MTIRLSTALRTAIVGTAGFSGAMLNGVIEVYSGPQPVTADSAVSGSLLGTITLNSAVFTPGAPTNGLTFATASAGTVSKTGVWSFVGTTVGTAGWFRFKGNAADAGGASTTALRLDGSIATSGGDLNLSNIAIVIGAPSTIDQFDVALFAQ